MLRRREKGKRKEVAGLTKIVHGFSDSESNTDLGVWSSHKLCGENKIVSADFGIILREDEDDDHFQNSIENGRDRSTFVTEK